MNNPEAPAGLGLRQIMVDSPGGRRSAHEMVRETLRRAIHRGVLSGGTRLNQANIARELDVSITPVREALRDLSAEGLVHFDAWKSVTVHSVTREELDEVYELRAMLESLAISRACERVTQSDLVTLRALAERMRAEKDPSRWLELNEEFHDTISLIAGYDRLRSMLASLRGVVSLYVGLLLAQQPDRREASDEDHERLIGALARRDVEEAIAVTRHHMDATHRTHAEGIHQIESETASYNSEEQSA